MTKASQSQSNVIDCPTVFTGTQKYEHIKPLSAAFRVMHMKLGQCLSIQK